MSSQAGWQPPQTRIGPGAPSDPDVPLTPRDKHVCVENTAEVLCKAAAPLDLCLPNCFGYVHVSES